MLNREEFIKLMASKGWELTTISDKIGIDVSHMYRMLQGQRGFGKKSFIGLLKLCKEEKLDIYKFVIFEE